MTNERKGFLSDLQLFGLPWQLFAVAFACIIFAAYKGVLSKDMAGTLALCIAIGGVFDEIGERLPIWNSYIGGGILMAFFGTAVLNQFGIIPEVYVKSIDHFISGNVNFLTFFIVCLITGSILSLDRKILFRSFAGYVPALLGGVAVAMLFGVGTGMLVGVEPTRTLVHYVLPIMGGGNGGGAVPLSQIYEQVTHQPSSSYYAFAIIILTIANVMCIVAGALLNKLGDQYPALTGDKSTLMRNASNEEEVAVTKVAVSLRDLAGAITIGVCAYVVGLLFAKVFLPTVFGAKIHQFAYMILFVILLAAFDVVPASVKAGAKQIQSFMVKNFSVIIMVGMGVDFDLRELAEAASFDNVLIALATVIGAIVGSAGVGYIAGFYPIDSAVTAGLCMANRGGNGDIAVLGASHRMELIAYAQLASRLGGGIVLVIASFLFSYLL